MRIPAAGEDRKCAVFGAVDYASGQVIFQMSARKGEAVFAAFLYCSVVTSEAAQKMGAGQATPPRWSRATADCMPKAWRRRRGDWGCATWRSPGPAT